MNPQSRPFAYPTVSPLDKSATEAAPPPELDSDARWNQWAEKGRRENAAFREKARVVAAIAAVVVAGGGVVWFLAWL